MENEIHYLKFKDKRPINACNEELVEDSEGITNDYHQVSCKDCKLILQLDILKIPVKKRTETMHLILVKHFGGVREYLLSMGEFKDVSINDLSVEENVQNGNK